MVRGVPTSLRSQELDDAVLAIATAYKNFCDLIDFVPYTVKVDVKTDIGTLDETNLMWFDGEGGDY